MPAFLFCALAALALSPLGSPPLALLSGLAYALLFKSPLAERAKTYTKPLLQWSVVGLGFGIDLARVWEAGSSGLLYTAAGIALTMALGWGLGKLLGVERVVSYLISTGTAVCGGSAIAAVGPILAAGAEEMSVALGTVFLLNSVALFVFPPLGHALGFSQEQFALWAALAIHDTSSVVGAAAKYGPEALALGATIKLARALWIVPLSLVTAAINRSKAKTPWPWFIGLFVAASAMRSFIPAGAQLYAFLNAAAKGGLRVTLLLIGAGLSLAALKKVGPRPLLQGIVLWCIVAGVTAALIHAGLLG